jgi:hypothetical protein
MGILRRGVQRHARDRSIPRTQDRNDSTDVELVGGLSLVDRTRASADPRRFVSSPVANGGVTRPWHTEAPMGWMTGSGAGR